MCKKRGAKVVTALNLMELTLRWEIGIKGIITRDLTGIPTDKDTLVDTYKPISKVEK